MSSLILALILNLLGTATPALAASAQKVLFRVDLTENKKVEKTVVYEKAGKHFCKTELMKAFPLVKTPDTKVWKNVASEKIPAGASKSPCHIEVKFSGRVAGKKISRQVCVDAQPQLTDWVNQLDRLCGR